MTDTDRSTSLANALLFFAAGFAVSRLFSLDRTRLAEEARLQAQLEWRSRSELLRQNRRISTLP